MLSAVAARKAGQVPPQPSHVVNNTTNTNEPQQLQQPSVKAPKRKPPRTQGGTKPKKSRKLKPFEKSNGSRKSDEFVAQADIITVDSEPEEMGVSDASFGQVMSMAESTSMGISEAASSDDDSMDETARFELADILPKLAQDSSDGSESPYLSSIKPVADQNIFFLGEEECSTLGLVFPATLICFNNSDTLCLLGSCNLSVVLGAIEICGVVLQADPRAHRIFAPRTAPLPIIRPCHPATAGRPLKADAPPARLKTILDFDAVVAVRELLTNVENLGKICKTFDGSFSPSRWHQASTTSPFNVPGLYMVSRAMKDLVPFTLPLSWSNALKTAVEPNDTVEAPVFLVKGPKNSGKSSFARTLVNQLLHRYRRVCFLECDVGQSELTPAGMVALNVISSPLFGPPFTHPSLPRHAHYIGSNTPRSHPSHYLDAISSLVQTYQLDIQRPIDDLDDSSSDPRINDSIPLIVNTMGWVKGLGADLNRQIEDVVGPTHIFDFQAAIHEVNEIAKTIGRFGGSESMDDVSAPPTVKRFSLDSITTLIQSLGSTGVTPTDHRNISILSYFHAIFPRDNPSGGLEDILATRWDTSKPLCAMPPYEVDCAVALDEIILTGAGSEDVVESEIDRVLNGAIVGLIAHEPGTIDISKRRSGGLPYTQQSTVPSPSLSRCIGLALIRGVSPLASSADNQTPRLLHLLTPVPPTLLRHCRVLVKGELEVPVWGMLDFRTLSESGDVAGVEAVNVPYLQWGKGMQGVLGGGKQRVRRNLMRRGQM